MRSVPLALSVYVVTAACSPPPDATVGTEDTEVVSQPIINGVELSFNAFSAAVYHKHLQNPCSGQPPGWFSRPCSGTVIKRTSTQSFVLTARHCVTEDGSIGGPLLPAGSLRVSTAVNPGIVSPGGTPPASALPATITYTAAGSDSSADLALIRVDSRLPLDGTQRMEVFRGSKELLRQQNAKVDFGYGRSQPGHCDGDVSSGAGRLRYASYFTFLDVQETVYTYNNTTATGQQIVHGDSGGGAFLREFDTGSLRLIGVHSTGAGPTGADAGSAALADFLQPRLGGLFLSRDVDRRGTNVVGAVTTSVGSSVTWQKTGDVSTNRVYFVKLANRLQMNGYCVNDEGSGVAVKLQFCNSAIATQNWAIGNGTIQNLSTGRCLMAHDAGLITTGPCDFSRAKWSWLTAAAP